ncbi:hypothetical protein [Streptomyces sp. WAC 06738]|uniref:hypothetical protein n=1 Tax=Streptomyces sp. WAC 06738 TaxID=2203210 RepID=UPI000F79390D|nr:hypothetical protein [Streptomyces sp. WAC 06738]
MNEEFKQLIVGAVDPLKREHGFHVKGRVAIRMDRLLRGVVFHPEKTATRGAYRFDVTLNLGLPGLSSVSASRREFIVAASLGKLYRLRNPGKGRFELRGDGSDFEVGSVVRSLLSDLCSEFLLAISGPGELLNLLENEAEFERLDLWPWNSLPRLELASVYSAFLGLEEQKNQFAERAISYAREAGMEYAVARIMANVQKATHLNSTD